MSRNPKTCRSHFFLLVLLTCLALIATQFAIPSSYSSNQDKSKNSKRKKTTAKPKPRGEAPRISGGRAAAEASDDQNPVDESLVVTTYDLPMVSAASFDGDVRELTPVATNMDQRSIDFEERLQELETPIGPPDTSSAQIATLAPLVTAPAPAPLANFPGLFRTEPVTGGNAGAGTPPDTNGDVGPNHYIISVNDAYGIYDKATGSRLAAFTENSLFSSGTRAGGLSGTGTLCDTNSFGDPVVVYDQLADRWILTNFAFVLNSSTGLWVPPIFQCFAASKTSNPVSGGWWVYAVRIDTGGTDYRPSVHLMIIKFGNWNDGCLYMGANAFNSAGNSSGAIFASLNRTTCTTACHSMRPWDQQRNWYFALSSNLLDAHLISCRLRNAKLLLPIIYHVIQVRRYSELSAVVGIAKRGNDGSSKWAHSATNWCPNQRHTNGDETHT